VPDVKTMEDWYQFSKKDDPWQRHGVQPRQRCLRCMMQCPIRHRGDPAYDAQRRLKTGVHGQRTSTISASARLKGGTCAPRRPPPRRYFTRGQIRWFVIGIRIPQGWWSSQPPRLRGGGPAPRGVRLHAVRLQPHQRPSGRRLPAHGQGCWKQTPRVFLPPPAWGATKKKNDGHPLQHRHSAVCAGLAEFGFKRPGL
jgi:hypothetical protein